MILLSKWPFEVSALGYRKKGEGEHRSTQLTGTHKSPEIPKFSVYMVCFEEQCE